MDVTQGPVFILHLVLRFGRDPVKAVPAGVREADEHGPAHCTPYVAAPDPG